MRTLGPPRPQTPRQGAGPLDPSLRCWVRDQSSLLPHVWLKATGELPGIRKQTGPTAKTNELVFGRPCCFPCALCAQAARFHRAARERRVISKFPASIAAFPAKNAAFSGSLFGFEERTPRSVPSWARPYHSSAASASPNSWQVCPSRVPVMGQAAMAFPMAASSWSALAGIPIWRSSITAARRMDSGLA